MRMYDFMPKCDALDYLPEFRIQVKKQSKVHMKKKIYNQLSIWQYANSEIN